MGTVRVINDDPPVHCIDLLNGQGERELRIRPKAGGVSIVGDCVALHLNPAALQELSSALSRIETQGRI